MADENAKFRSSYLTDSAFAVPTGLYYHYPFYQHLSNNTSAALAAYEALSCTNLPTDEVVAALQTQHLRFPTPPITPPTYTNKAYSRNKLTTTVNANKNTTGATSSPNTSYDYSANTTTDTGNKAHTAKERTRTQSVIMKIEQDQLITSRMPPTPENVDMAVDIVGLDDVADGAEAVQRQLKITSEISSASSSPKRSEYTCEWIDCGRDHSTLEALATHVTKIHAVASHLDGLYYCRWRGCARMRGFSARYKMLVHARTHTKEKPHQCHLCEKCFSRAENLKIHIRSHSGEKPYICTYEGCNKAYSNSSDRFKHTRTHAMDKPYMCKVPGCQKRYTDPSSLRKHVKTFKHTTQLIATAAVTAPYKNNSGRGDGDGGGIGGGQTTSTRQHQKLSETSKPIPTLPTVIHHATASLHDSHHLHANGYAKGFSDVTIPVCQLCVPPPPPPHYYLNSIDEDLCSIKAAQLDYYYAATANHSPARSSTASSSWSSVAHSDVSSTVAMDVDAPLDLRVNRR